jgi:hypothetical protein
MLFVKPERKRPLLSSYQRCRRVLGNMSTPQRYFFWAVQHPNQIAMGWRSRSKYDRAGYRL